MGRTFSKEETTVEKEQDTLRGYRGRGGTILKERITFGISLDRAVYDRICQIADDTEVSLAHVIRRAIAKGLD